MLHEAFSELYRRAEESSIGSVELKRTVMFHKIHRAYDREGGEGGIPAMGTGIMLAVITMYVNLMDW